MKIIGYLAIACMALLQGCAILKQTYTGTAEAPAGINVNTDSGDKLGGNWVLVLDDSLAGARRTNLKPSGNVCSLHDFSFDASNAMVSTGRKMAAQLFESVAEAKELPTTSTVAQDQLAGAITIKLDDFSPRFTCSMGGTEASCNATAEVSLSVTLLQYQPTTTRRSFSVNSQRSTDGPGGSLCGNTLSILGQATSRATKDAYERVAERVAGMVK